MYRLCQVYNLLVVEDDPYIFIRYPHGPGGCRDRENLVWYLGVQWRVELCAWLWGLLQHT